MQQYCPELSIKAWFIAWQGDPENQVLQDNLLQVFLDSGAVTVVGELGLAFLPARWRANTHLSLLGLLRQHQTSPFGACWKSGSAIEVMVFKLVSLKAVDDFDPQRLQILIDNELTPLVYEVPEYGQCFKLNFPQCSGTWSLALAIIIHLQLNRGY